MSDGTCPACIDPDIIVPVSRETTEVFKTGTWSSTRPRFAEKTSPCRAACPAGNNISAALRAAAAGDFDAALAAFLEESPLPGICGRVCYHPCQPACNRGLTDGSLQIRALERAAADYGQADPVVLSRAGEHYPVAVVGSGPAGLSCAYHLARMGHPVTIYEAEQKPGGLLARGIPGFRLPENILQRELSRIWKLGVALKTGQDVGPARLKSLLGKHAAVFLAPGADKHRCLNVEGEGLENVVPGLDFLRRSSLQNLAASSDVAVIGGGNTAMDAARTALRAGARSVTVVYRRTRDEMPAFDDEVAQAEAEGVRFATLAAPVAFLGTKRLKAVRLVRMEPAETEADGRKRPVPVEGSESDLPCGLAIVAAGQTPAGRFMEGGFRWNEDRMRVDGWQRTSSPGIFAGGDLTPARASVVDAVAGGKKAALGIHLTVTGRSSDMEALAVTLGAGPAFSLTACYRKPENRRPEQVAVPDPLTLCMAPARQPVRFAEADAAERVRSGVETSPGFSKEAAEEEAGRCLVCGTCVGCNRCLVFCPEGAVVPPEETGGEYLYRNEFCKGCGVCASVCLRGVMEPGEDR